MGGDVEFASDFNEDSDRLQEVLEKAGFCKDEVELINEHHFKQQEHLVKIRAVFAKTPDAFVFTENDCLSDSDEFETGITVFNDNQQKYIIAKINQDNMQVDQELVESLLNCFTDDNFNLTQQRHNISETIKLTWI